MSNVYLKNFKLIVLWAIIFGLLAGLGSIFLPRQYSAQSQVLVISKDRSGVDPYTQAKSAEQIGGNLAQVMKTDDFYQRVLKTSYSFDKTRWTALSARKARQQWNKDLEISTVYGTGLMNIVAYSKTKKDAVDLATAVGQTVANEGWEYAGGNVLIKYVSGPLEPLFPSRPNYVLNICLGIFIGAVLCALWLAKYRRHNLF
ncbi:MAG: hypothetical protein COU31_00925 [Candidatus Magasanikbacteria bacterium CG10_big_fil_rev_8_21_14_0_10_40_10]|uniref:Polysaccharide chain length determinant N-terminal domain-containing protein n=1 Tax=Candidatus Magasanikbacteria bacterium CG10_big_fil_rev_8_21_14_0_10_40_10 TaxID=1974648 RepID=A0A2M6W4Q9_9BACT|nr:MAG: hypothetical protein COU31_00925 [Candidatus Magasanikbacteria bacterium CG10_big_fil_rev_8_21_14_0_10_40_10]